MYVLKWGKQVRDKCSLLMQREREVGSLNELASECSTETLYNKLLRHVRTFGLDHLFVFNVVICHSKLK